MNNYVWQLIIFAKLHFIRRCRVIFQKAIFFADLSSFLENVSQHIPSFFKQFCTHLIATNFKFFIFLRSSFHLSKFLISAKLKILFIAILLIFISNLSFFNLSQVWRKIKQILHQNDFNLLNFMADKHGATKKVFIFSLRLINSNHELITEEIFLISWRYVC
jgi:hypothetical protein